MMKAISETMQKKPKNNRGVTVILMILDVNEKLSIANV